MYLHFPSLILYLNPSLKLSVRKTVLFRGTGGYLVHQIFSQQQAGVFIIAQPGVQEAVHEDLYHFASSYWQHSQPLHPSKNDVALSEPFGRVKGDISHCGRWCSCLEFCFQVAAFQWPLCEREKFLRQAWQLCFEHLCCSCHTMITVQADGRPGIGGFMQIYASSNLKIQSEGQEGLAVKKTKFLPRRMKLYRKLRAFEARLKQAGINFRK